MPKSNFVAEAKIAQILAPAADAAGRQSRAISLKYHTFISILAHISQKDAAPVTLTLMQAKNAAGLDAKPLGSTAPIWANQDAGNTDTMNRVADGVAFTTSAAIADKQVVMHIDPAGLDVNNGYDHVFITTSASAAANITSAQVVAQGPRYQGGNAPSIFL